MKKRRKFKRTIAFLLATALYICCDSKYNLRLTEYRLAFERLPKSFEGFKIVQLSDLHGMEFGSGNSRLAELVEKQQPDIIAITGDVADDLPELQAFENLLKGIAHIAPIYYVSGNHEFASGSIDEVRALLEKYGVKSLENEYEQFYRMGDSIVVAGAEDPNGRADMIKPEKLAENIRQENPDSFVLWLGHRNFWVEKYPELPVDLILSGHAHGGIVRLPFVGGLLSTAHGLWATYEKGLYYGDEYVMAVSVGLGNSVPVPRFLNRPELVSIILEKK